MRRSLRPNPKGTLREQVHEVCRFLHFSERTEAAYWQWIVRFLKFHRGKGVGAHGVARPAAGAWRHP